MEGWRDTNQWGSLGPPGLRTRAAVLAKAKQFGLNEEHAKDIARNIWGSELAFREGTEYNAHRQVPYPNDPRVIPPVTRPTQEVFLL